MPIEENQPGHDRPAPSRVTSFLLLILAALWCIYWFIHGWHYWEDDAYIHLEFARSVAAGLGFAFNGKVVDGDTAPLWALLLGAVHAVIPNWIIAGKILTVFGAAFGLAGLYALARSLLTSRLRLLPDAALFPAAMVLLIAVNPYFCYWAFSGMESIAAAGLACWAVLAATHQPPSSKIFLAACLIAGIEPLLRPEMVFLSLLVVVPLFTTWRRLPSSSTKPTIFIAGLLLLSAPQTLWALYSLHAFGHLLPNTNAAKRAAPAASVVQRLLTVYTWAFPVILCGLLVGLVYLFLRPARVRNSLRTALISALEGPGAPPPGDTFARSAKFLPTFSLTAWIFFLWFAITTAFYIADHTYVQTRYILVIAPGLTIVFIAFIFRISPRACRILYLAALFSSAVISIVIVRPFIYNKGIDCDVARDMAVYIHNNIPPDAPVAVYSIGEIAFVSQHPIVDIGGITRPGAIPYLNDRSLDRMVRWAVSQGAHYFIEAHPPEPGAIPVFTIDMKYVGWTLDSARYGEVTPVHLWKLPPPSIPVPRPNKSGDHP